ncbi:hypothetical protein AB9F26_11580 [Falsihalocynthiibacter sp. BN13B15]
MERVLSDLLQFATSASDHARVIAPERFRAEAKIALQRNFAL